MHKNINKLRFRVLCSQMQLLFACKYSLWVDWEGVGCVDYCRWSGISGLHYTEPGLAGKTEMHLPTAALLIKISWTSSKIIREPACFPGFWYNFTGCSITLILVCETIFPIGLKKKKNVKFQKYCENLWWCLVFYNS